MEGLVTGFCFDKKTHLLAFGSSNGYCTLFDMNKQKVVDHFKPTLRINQAISSALIINGEALFVSKWGQLVYKEDQETLVTLQFPNSLDDI